MRQALFASDHHVPSLGQHLQDKTPAAVLFWWHALSLANGVVVQPLVLSKFIAVLIDNVAGNGRPALFL